MQAPPLDFLQKAFLPVVNRLESPTATSRPKFNQRVEHERMMNSKILRAFIFKCVRLLLASLVERTSPTASNSLVLGNDGEVPGLQMQSRSVGYRFVRQQIEPAAIRV
jgi:hypothetical protein